jgi:hypothetical protein
MTGLATLLTLALAAQAPAPDRDAKVRADRDRHGDGYWAYNDVESARLRALAEGKPLLVVFRCIPCEACHEFDEEVASRDPLVRDLMDRFVGVRVVSMNDADLSRFQHDFDQSFAVAFLHPDGTLLGRFGTRSNERDESADITLEGLREALGRALAWHADYESIRPALAGKQVEAARFRTPLDYPSLAGRYERTLDYEGAVARSCVHCHQVGEAERRFFRDRGEPIPEDVLFPYPNPRVLGLAMDPEHAATVAEVAPGSSADRDGFRAGDEIATLDGQPLLSIADIQWALHHAPEHGTLRAEVVRDGGRRPIELTLDEGWRRRGDLSWRATTWDLRRMALGGMELEPATEAERRAAGIADGKTALRVGHVGEYGEHAVAKDAGIRAGDLVVAYDGRDDLATETDLIARGVRHRRPGDEVVVTVLRDGRRLPIAIRLQ